MSLNYAILIGRLVRDPEYSMTPSGIPVTRFTVAVDRYKRQDGNSSADFIRVVAWRRLAEICKRYLKKGKLIAVDGRLQIDTFEKNGVQRQSAEIVADNMQMLDRGIQDPGASFDTETKSDTVSFQDATWNRTQNEIPSTTKEPTLE